MECREALHQHVGVLAAVFEVQFGDRIRSAEGKGLFGNQERSISGNGQPIQWDDCFKHAVIAGSTIADDDEAVSVE